MCAHFSLDKLITSDYYMHYMRLRNHTIAEGRKKVMERTLHEKTLLDGIFAPIEEKGHPVKCTECGWKGYRARLGI